MASALGTGILGLLAGLGQGMERERARKYAETQAERDRQQSISEKEQERLDKLAIESQRQGYEQKRIEEEARSNKVREGLDKQRVDIEQQRALDQSNFNDIMLQVTGRINNYERQIDELRLKNEFLTNKKLTEKETDPTKTPAYFAQKFQSEGIQELLKNPALLRQPEVLNQAVETLRTQAYQLYGTTGNPAQDQLLLENLKNLAGGTEDTGKGGNMPTAGQPNPFMRYLTGTGKALGGYANVLTEELLQGTAEKSLKENARRNYKKSKTPVRTER